MASTVNAEGPQLMYSDPKGMPGFEIEQEKRSGHEDSEAHDDVANDSSSERKQDGVKRVEAITQVWNKKLLIVMFILYAMLSGFSLARES